MSVSCLREAGVEAGAQRPRNDCESRRLHDRAMAPIARHKGSYSIQDSRAGINAREIIVSNIIWIIVIGFVAGIIARFLSPGPNEPSGFILTTLLGIAGAFLATFIGQTIGWYRLDQGAGLIGATVGALIVLFIWNRLVVHHVVSDPGGPDLNAGPPGRP
jgi:uncharacterized membrane protein YeaQ/YmgE (transglycosylase-associated protein family)